MTAAATSAFRLHPFGAATLERMRDGQADVVLRAGKPLALLQLLSAAEGRPVTREQLADQLWGDESSENARASLRQALYALRQILGDDLLVSERDQVTLVADAVACDRRAVIDAARRGALDEMLRLAHAPFWEGTLAAGASGFERWAENERRRLDGLLVDQALTAIPAWLAAGEATRAREAALEMARRFPERSEVAILAFDTLVAAGAIAEATERLSAHAAWLLAQEFTPPPDVEERLARVRRRAQQTPAVAPGGLYSVGQTCVGRDALLLELLREAEQARAGSPRRVLLVGPAGVGKTRVLDELEARLRLRGARVVRVGFLPGGSEVALSGLAAVVRALADLPGALGVGERSARRLLSLVPELADRFPGAARAGAIVEPGLQGLPEAMEDVLAAVAEDRPVVLMLDNMDFADFDSLRGFASITLRPGSRLLAVGASRRGITPDLPADGTTVMDVLPIGEADVRALLRAVAALPEAEWMRALVTALLERSRGIPQAALAAVRSLGAAGLLRVENGQWTCADPAALLTAARETAGTASLVDGLDARAREVLDLLATWGRPLEERDLAGVLALAPTPMPLSAVREALRRLEALGLIQSRDTSWGVAHDNVAEELRRLAAPMAPVAPAELLQRYWTQDERFTVQVLDHLAWMAARDRTLRQLRSLVKAAAKAPAIRGAGLRGAELAAHVARTSGLPIERDLRRALGFWARQTERVRVAAAVGLTLAAIGAGWLLERLQPRVVVVTPPMVEGSGIDLVDLAVQPRVRVENGFGRPSEARYALRATVDYGRLYGDTLLTSEHGEVAFTRLAYRAGPPTLENRPVHLIVHGPWYVRSGRAAVVGAGTVPPKDEFRVLSVHVNGRDITDSLAVDVAAGDSLRVDVTFEYTTVHATANYIVGAAALWEPRDRAAIRLAGLPRPVQAARRLVSFAVSAPPERGDHWVVLLFDLEDTAEHMFAGSNWKSGAPRWFDGNDVHDQPPAFFEALRRDGAAPLERFEWGGRRIRQRDIRYGDSIYVLADPPMVTVAKQMVGRAILVRRR